MPSQAQLDYQRIEQAIAYIRQHQQNQPSLAEIAAAVQLSPYYFQRLLRASSKSQRHRSSFSVPSRVLAKKSVAVADLI